MAIYDFLVKTATGSLLPLKSYQGKLILIVNVASACRFTYQYDGLEALAKKYAAQGFIVLGFPCNQFAHQESASDAEIQSFCRLNHGVSFPILAKVEVNGSGADPLFTFLKTSAPGFLGIKSIKWNFTKFLVDRNGQVIKRYAPTAKPESLVKDIESALAL